MKKTERIIAAILTMIMGILVIILKGNLIGILMTVIGLGLIVFGVVELIERFIPPAVIKIFGGLLTIICGWWVIEAVLYVLAAVLLICGILLLYDKIKQRIFCKTLGYAVCEYAVPVVCIGIGGLLLFHQNLTLNFIFITSGILSLIVGVVLLYKVYYHEE